MIWSDIQSINEASQLTDYPVATLTFLPPGFNADQTFNIGLTSGSPEVNQYWEGPGGLYLSLTQSLTLDGVIGDRPAEKIEINGKEGEIIYIGDNPPSISIYWRESKMSYVLNAQLEGPLSKEMIVKLAKSVQ